MGRLLKKLRVVICACGALACAGAVFASAQDANRSPAAPASQQQGTYLVFPFENAGASPRLDWLGEGLEELTIQHLSAAGQDVYSHAGRASELERYGLPASAKLSRATMLRIAQDLDADFVIFGSFSSDGTSLKVESRIMRVDPASLLPQVTETGALDSLMEMSIKLAWDLVSSNDPKYKSLAQFAKVQHTVRLDAFEHYVRGLLSNDDDARLRELREAARLEPGWADAEFALGDSYFSRNDCESALPWFAHISSSYSRYVEALFATGVCRLQLNQPERAEEVFKLLQSSLRQNTGSGADTAASLSGADLPEILNDLAIALARQGKEAAAETDLQRATELDPDDDDYPFNLGLLAMNAKEFDAAADHFREAVGREPDSAEDRAFLIEALEKAGKKDEADEERGEAEEALGPQALEAVRADAKSDATARKERLKTELDITALRLEIEAAQPATNANARAAVAAADMHGLHVRLGREELTAGHLEEAEKQFQEALELDGDASTLALAHRGLGEIARRRGKLEDAVKEFQASLEARDSAVVRTKLAKIYLEQKKSDLARSEVERALKLAPNYVEAKQLLEHLQNSKPNGGGND